MNNVWNKNNDNCIKQQDNLNEVWKKLTKKSCTNDVIGNARVDQAEEQEIPGLDDINKERQTDGTKPISKKNQGMEKEMHYRALFTKILTLEN